MPEINSRYQFEPDDNARKAWLATRKKPLPYALPGFYNTIDYDKDTSWFMLALCVEAAAIVLTLYGGIMKGGVFLVGSIITVVLFLVFDWVGANFCHQNFGPRCLIRNKIRIEDDSGAQEGLRRDLKKGILVEIVGISLIVISAIFKILAILLLGKFNIIFYAIMALLYLIVIYIHIAHTGFFFAEKKASNMFKDQYNQWSEDRKNMVGKTLLEGNIKFGIRIPAPTTSFTSEIKLKLDNNKIQVGEHSIKLTEEQTSDNNQKIYLYEIEAIGLIIDDDITLFTRGQSNQAGNTIAEACLKHQLHYH